MPVDRNHSRFLTHGHGTLGTATIWDCPACGSKNEGRRPEQGCIHCGSGDPTKSKAGQAEVLHDGVADRVAGEPGTPIDYPPPPRPARRISQEAFDDREQIRQSGAVRILRLIEYIVRPGQNADEVLRRSLVGKMEFPWGSITGAIVDSCDATQEDRLRLARMQPGVWLGNPSAVDDRSVAIPYAIGAQRALEHFEGEHLKRNAQRVAMQGLAQGTGRLAEVAQEELERIMEQPPMPDTGPAYSATDAALAKSIYAIGGYKLCYTLALALSSVAEELATNAEPEKLLTYDEALQLANALMQLIPSDWQGAQEERAAAQEITPEERQAARERAQRISEASVPTAVYRDVKSPEA